MNELSSYTLAHGRTIFLDEIGEISQATQVNLSRVLDTSVFRHAGGTGEIRVDVRVLAATNRDLRAIGGQGGADVELLASHFVGLLNGRYGSHLLST